jgi:uncharacterized protein
MSEALAPVAGQQRLEAIDAIRGVAVLGILAMNIVGFAFHPAVYSDPTVAGGAQGLNLWVFILNAILMDGKMRGMFTLLFGAGVYLLASRGEQRGSGDVADVYYRRNLWLLLFGVAHAYLLWWGEVLYPYAVLGLMLFPFRRMSARGLVILSSVLVLAMIGGGIYEAIDAGKTKQKALAAQALKKEGKKLTEDQEKAVAGWEERLKFMKPDAAALKKNHDQNTGGFVSTVKARAEMVGFFHHLPLYSPMFWDFTAMMFLGMALIKTGVLTAERSTAFYVKLAAAGYLIGLPLHGVQLWLQLHGWFDVIASAWAGVFYEPARIAVCLGHVAVWMLVFRLRWLPGLTRVLAATGQMALTNYLMQSVICTLVFNVLKLHGSMQRYQVYFVVAAIWLLELAWSPLWLRRFRFGPAEWCWRSLTYWRRQPMLAHAAPAGFHAPSGEPVRAES